MICDRQTDAVTAIVTSVNAVLRNKRVMVVWALPGCIPEVSAPGASRETNWWLRGVQVLPHKVFQFPCLPMVIPPLSEGKEITLPGCLPAVVVPGASRAVN